jgi:nicotinamidase-related amidase
MQRWFYDETASSFWDDLLSHVAEALSLARSAGVPVVHVITRYSRDRSDWPKAWLGRDAMWCLEGTTGVEILEQVAPLEGEPVVVKTRFSGFYGTDLDRVLQASGVDTLFIAGFASDVCVRLTTMDAYNCDYDLYLLSECVHAAREDTAASIDYLAWLTNLQVLTNQELTFFLDGME